MILPFHERLAQAIRQIGKTEAERAAKLGYSVRQVDNIERGQGIAKTLAQWEEAGIIHITGDCPCTRPKHGDEKAAA